MAGCEQDTEGVVQGGASDELHLDLDYVVPFAAIPEGGRDIGRIDQISEMAHRMMLTNVLRLLGGIKNAKSERGIETRPALVVMPCSPNHGVFGILVPGSASWMPEQRCCSRMTNQPTPPQQGRGKQGKITVLFAKTVFRT